MYLYGCDITLTISKLEKSPNKVRNVCTNWKSAISLNTYISPEICLNTLNNSYITNKYLHSLRHYSIYQYRKSHGIYLNPWNMSYETNQYLNSMRHHNKPQKRRQSATSMIPYQPLKKNVSWLPVKQQDVNATISLTKELEKFAEYISVRFASTICCFLWWFWFLCGCSWMCLKKIPEKIWFVNFMKQF